MKRYRIWFWPCGIREEFCVIDVFLSFIHIYVCLVYIDVAGRAGDGIFMFMLSSFYLKWVVNAHGLF